MTDRLGWDWETKEKLVADINEWKKKYSMVLEPVVSPDGERISAMVRTDDNDFTPCVNGSEWEQTFEKVWSLQFGPDQRLSCIVMNDDAWTVATDGQLWEEAFEYVWGLKINLDGSNIAANVKLDDKYSIALNGVTWDSRFQEMRNVVLSPNGERTAGNAQTKELGEGDIFGFFEGVWTVIVDGRPWEKIF